MKRMNADVFDVDPLSLEDGLPAVPVSPKGGALAFTEQDVLDDASYCRETLRHLSARSQQLVEVSLDRVLNGGTSKDIDAATQAISIAAQQTERLLQFHEKMKSLQQTPLGNGNTFVQNQVICGSTAELLAALKNETTGETKKNGKTKQRQTKNQRQEKEGREEG